MNCCVLHNPLNGRSTTARLRSRCSYEDARTQQSSSNHWCSSEYNRANGRNVNLSSGNMSNNNKYNTNNVSRPVAAYRDCGVPDHFVSSVWEAYHDCVRGKMSSKQALEYMCKAPADIPLLAQELWTGNYTPTTSTCFMVRYPKFREVFAASFRDRVVHHWICLRLNPLFEERFVSQGNVSFNCRKGFGTEKAVEYVSEGMRCVSNNYRREAWVFKGDLVGFFMSIRKELMWYLLARFIHRRYKGEDKAILMATTRKIVMHRPEQNCILNSPAEWWYQLDRNKSLFTSNGQGMPIGNLTTQLFVNHLLSFFDSYVQWLFRRKNYCYARFVDDFAIICDDKQAILDALPKIERFLEQKLQLRMHKDKRYLQPVSHGVKFVGSYIKPGRIYLSNRTLARFEERCEGFKELLARREPTLLDCQRMTQVLNSYMGFCIKRRTYRIRRDAINGIGPPFWKSFCIEGHYESIRIKNHITQGI